MHGKIKECLSYGKPCGRFFCAAGPVWQTLRRGGRKKYTNEIFPEIDIENYLKEFTKGNINNNTIFSGIIKILGKELANSLKIIISILFIVFILMIVHVPKVYGATITLDGITYDINGNQATVINGSGVSGDITIDSTIRTVNAEVVRIGASAFANNNRITSITVIGNGSTPIVIEDAAFYNCKSLNRVILEQNIVLNGISIFQKCSALSDCYMQNSNVSDIPEYSFNQCSNLNTINFSNNTRTIQR